MANIYRVVGGPHSPARVMPGTRPNPFGLSGSKVGLHVTRRGFFENRSAKRWGDWSSLEVPLALLWLDSAVCVPGPYGTCQPLVPPMVSLWP